jgi:hypothetical protein
MAHYQVVEKRVFGLSLRYGRTEIGRELPIMAVNSDKLKGEVAWKLTGVGVLQPQGKKAIFHSLTEGQAKVTASDSNNPDTRAEAEIEVLMGDPKKYLICIRGEYFELRTTAIGAGKFAKPVTMIKGDKVHRLEINQQAPGYQDALDKGIFPLYLLNAMAMEFARFSRFELDGLNLAEVDPRDLPSIMDECLLEGYKIQQEILPDFKGKNA